MIMTELVTDACFNRYLTVIFCLYSLQNGVKGAGLHKVTNVFQNDNFAVHLIGHITEILRYFSKMKVLLWRGTLEFRRETNETLICCRIVEILVDIWK